MQAYVIEKTLMENGKLILSGLPFKTDELVQVIILHKSKPKAENSLNTNLRSSLPGNEFPGYYVSSRWDSDLSRRDIPK